jgi:hypothetical protein
MRKIMTRTTMMLALLLASSLAILFACKKGEMVDFYTAIYRYGFKSAEPIAKKAIKTDPQICAGFVYKSVPIVISAIDALTYKVSFLSVELDKPDMAVEAFMSEVNGGKYLNLNLGECYAFLKIGDLYNELLEVKLLRNNVAPYVEVPGLRNWLQKNGDKEEFIGYDSAVISIYYGFTFEKITAERAYAIQAEELALRKAELFEGCFSYFSYDELEKKYPGDPLLTTARKNLLSACKNIPDYETFITRFPDDPLADEARTSIREIVTFRNDSTGFRQAEGVNTIDAYLLFRDGCKTACFMDSAMLRIRRLADGIGTEKIEWNWIAGYREEAIRLMFYKIDYSAQNYDVSWYAGNLALYCLRTNGGAFAGQGITYLDKLAAMKVTNNQMLDLYLSKGFLLWYTQKNDLAVELFRAKISENYEGEEGLTFRKALFARYGEYNELRIVFPEEKKTWKIIKKLKNE